MPGPPPPGGANPPAAQPVTQCKVLHWVTVRLLREPYRKAKPDWWVSPPSSPYPSEQFDAEITDGHKDAESDGSGSASYLDIPAGNCSVKFKYFYRDIEKALHPARFQDARGLSDPPSPAAAPPPNFSVDLIIQKNVLTLKHDHQSRLEVKVTPAGVAVDEYRIEIKRASGGSWCTLSTNAVVDPWFARIAGKFKLRGVAKVAGTEHQSPEKDVEVHFPTYPLIVADGAVKTGTDIAWCDTLADCTANPNQRRERGFWILLNTTTDAYEFGPTVIPTAWQGPTQGAGVSLPPRPPDKPASPSPCDPGAVYSVASFHTHTPTEFRVGPGLPPGTRGVGPSGADNNADNTDDVPGVVYDYVESPAGSGSIPMGHPKNSPSKLYFSAGKNKRTIPP